MLRKEAGVKVTFITKPGCHLCDEARPVLEGAITELAEAGIQVTCEELNMLDDEQLIAEYQEDIPVVLINGKRHSYWHVDHGRFVEAVKKQSRRSFFGKLRNK